MLNISERRACRALGQHRSTQRKAPRGREDEAQLTAELAAAGFTPDAGVPLREHNRRAPGTIPSGAPVIYEAAYRLA